MSAPPELSRKDIGAEVQRLYAAQRKRHLFAFYGTGGEDIVDVEGAGRVFIHPVKSEIELRSLLGKYDDDGDKIVFLVPWRQSLPLDLAGRFALQGRVHPIGVETRLARMFGVSEVDERVRDCPLARHLLSETPDAEYHVPSGRLTEPVLWSHWLREAWAVPLGTEPSIEALLGWAAWDRRGHEWAAAFAQGPSADVRAALLAYLERRLGAMARHVWVAWEAGTAEALLELGLVLGAVEASQTEAVALWRRMKLRELLGVTDPAEAQAAAQSLALTAGSAYRVYGKKAGPAAQRTLLERADALADDPAIRDATEASPRLPSGWRARLRDLGAALIEGAAGPTASAVSEARSRLDALVEHERFADPDNGVTVKRATMAVRLLAWLAARPDQALEGPPSSYSDAELLGRWYAAEGGFVDWARTYARGTGEGPFHAGVAAIVDRADDARQELDRRFARGLRAWVEAGRPMRQLVPIDRALEKIAVPFVDRSDEHRLLVLLLDGMAWAQAVELLGSLARRAIGWGPLRWHQRAAGKIGDGVYPVVVATLPTETDVSRAAFFAGEPVPDGKKEPTSKDPERFRGHRAIAKYFAAPEHARLLLRSTGHTDAGAASEAALTLVGDTTQRVVGIVINAIDASLKGDPQHQPQWSVDAIQSLPQLLDKAREVGRDVLLASDHGHVPAGRFQSVERATPGGTRWREWRSPDEDLHDWELGFRGEGVFIPRGAHGVVLCTDDAHRYGSRPHAGEHGGATLAEVLAPCLLIGCAGDADEASDRGVMGAFTPSWWFFDVREPVERGADAPVVRGGRKTAASTQQLPLSGLGAAPPARPASRAPGPAFDPGLAAPLAASAVFKGRTAKDQREEVLRAVSFLLGHNGVVGQEAFAAAMGELPFRVPGIVANLASVLNVDGYDVLSFDSAGQQVRLNVGQMNALFLEAP